MVILGLDVGKSEFHAALVAGDARARVKSFANNPKGFEQLATWLRNRHVERVHACLEATGGWSEALATELHDRGHVVSLVNPQRIRVLYFPALVAMKWNPASKSFAGRLRARGKRPMVIVAAAMRKLLVLAYGVVKSGRPFDPALTTQHGI